MFPLGDDNAGRRLAPVLNIAFIVVNVLVFVVLQGLGRNDRFTYAFSAVPAEIATGRDAVTADRVVQDPISGGRFRAPGLQPTPIPVYLTLLTSMFMHGGLMHLAGNMLYLWIFGDNVEDTLGHGRYAAFYVACGILAGLAHVVTTIVLGGNALIPSLGASGAISGVMGAYLVLHPHRRVRVLMFRHVTEVPAIVAIGTWFAFQLISGLGVLGAASREGGVAYAAHVGGFVAGVVLVKLFAPGPPRAPRFA